MSDFLNPSRASSNSVQGGVSAFNKLSSGIKVPEQPEKTEKPDAKMEQAAVVGLSSSVRDLEDSAKSVREIPEALAQVETENVQASESAVRDVRAAAELADKISRDVPKNPDLAQRAQVAGLEAEKVKRFLG